MGKLLIVGAGLFGSMAAALARRRGHEVRLFDARHEGAASAAAAGLFKQAWAGQKLGQHYREAIPVLEELYGIGKVELRTEHGPSESFQFVPPRVVLETAIRAEVTEVGDGWLRVGEEHYEGDVYVAAGVWCSRFFPALGVYGKAGASFSFAGEREGRIRVLDRSRQAIAFVRDPGLTHFSDGTAEREYGAVHERRSLANAAAMGLADVPVGRHWGIRPYVSGGPVFRRMGERLWVGTGGRKMGTILAAAFARRLMNELGGGTSQLDRFRADP